MEFKYRQSPYQNTRTPFIVTKPMLTHGDQNYSLCKYLSQKKRLYTSQQPVTDRQIEQQILWKYQKQYYGYDQNGYSLALWDYDRKIQLSTQKSDGFQVPFFGVKTQRDQYTRSETASTRSLETHFLEQNNAKFQVNKQRKPHIKSPRQRNRQQINKIKSKLKQIQGNQLKRQDNNRNIGVLGLYKAKKALQYFPGLITFGELQVEPNIRVDQKKTQSNSQFGEGNRHKKIYPQSIYINKEQYFKIRFK